MLSTVLLLAASSLLAQPDRYGLPACTAPDQQLLRGSAFILCYSSASKVPLWSAYELTPERLHGPASRTNRFRPDPRIAGPSSLNSDYRGSHFSRGHLVPAADLTWNEEAMRESFYLSNVAPQNSSLNAGKWRILESRIRRLAAASDSVLVFTGPVFCHATERIGAGQVAVPCKLYKIALSIHAGQMKMFAAILPNDRNPCEPLTMFAVPVAEVEQATNLDFFPQLPIALQAVLETSRQPLP